MTTFDGWEARLTGDAMALPDGQLSENELMHFRTKGSKNGVRRYQQPDGTWTPLGLRERKQREGWGESRKQRKADLAVYKSERRAAKAERRLSKINAKKEKKANKEAKRAARAEAVRKAKAKHDISKLTDEELKAKIARVKMEQEYKELTRSPLLKTGEKLVKGYFEQKAAKAEREASKAKLELENNRVKADIIKAKESTKKAKAETEGKRAEMNKMKWDVKGGKKIERQTELQKAKTEWKGTTLHGNIIRAIGTRMNAGLKDKYTAKRKAEGEIEAARILSDGQYANKKHDQERDMRDRNAGVKAYEKQQTKLRKERVKTQSTYESRVKKMQSDQERLQRQQQARAERREKERQAEVRRRQEQAERERRKRERQLQRAYNKEINRYDNAQKEYHRRRDLMYW